MRYEPIVTAYLKDDSLRLHEPMHRLASDAQSPAQFIFDLHALSGLPAHQGVFALVASSAAEALRDNLATCTDLLLSQAQRAFAGHFRQADAVWHVAAERRATFACTAGLVRPAPCMAPQLWAAGDYVDGPYPATLEGAVRAGLSAAQQLGMCRQNSIP